ncbi:MAG: N-acetylneuraminate synthase [Candidatus Omnitrophica bacterium]|nr:N-acetylneuraminate synthase [Candidatus Omnitrophota bacterium]
MKTSRVLIIAEAGVNHNGDVVLAKKLIDAAVESGADMVKFQTFQTELNISKNAPKAAYQIFQENTESQYDMIKKLELSQNDFKDLFEYAKEKSIQFCSTPDDLASVDFLDSIGLAVFKIGSGEITNLPLLRRVGSKKKNVILSTGLSTMDEVRTALDILINAGTDKNNICLLHCTSEYPAPLSSVNLKAMVAMRETLGVRVGYSDHTLGCEAAVVAVALGAEVIEKHLTLDRTMKGPDHQASCEPQELKELVRVVRGVEECLGSGVKQAANVELKNIAVIRRSIVAARPIRKGQIISEQDILAKRPGTGLSPMVWDTVVGTKAVKDFNTDEFIVKEL